MALMNASDYGYREVWAVTNIIYVGRTVTKKKKGTGKEVIYHKFMAQMWRMKADFTPQPRHHTFSLKPADNCEAKNFLRAIGVEDIPTMFDPRRLPGFFDNLDAAVAKARPHITFEYDKDTDPAHWQMINIQPYAGPLRVEAIIHGFDDDALRVLKKRGEAIYEKAAATRKTSERSKRVVDGRRVRGLEEAETERLDTIDDGEEHTEGEDRV